MENLMDSVSSNVPAIHLPQNIQTTEQNDSFHVRIFRTAWQALGEVATGIKNAAYSVYRFFASVMESITNTVRKIILFMRRHKMVFITYAISLGLMIAMGATAGQIAAALIPGMIWTLANVKGEMLPEDLLIKGERPLSDASDWLPQNKEEAQESKALLKRLEMIERIEKLIQIKGEMGWVLLHGAPRIGKSVIADEILKRAEANGQEVFRLSKEIYDVDSKNPYLTVAETLSNLGKESEKPPILFIDEFGKIPQKLFRAIYEKKIDCNILAVQSDLKDDNFQELEFYERFEKIKVPYLDVEGCITTLRNIYKEENLISNENIERLVKDIACRLGEFGKKKLLYLSIKAIERASTIPGTGVISWEALNQSIQTIKLYKKNFVELHPKVSEEEFDETKNKNTKILRDRQIIIDECVQRLSTGSVYLGVEVKNDSQECMKEIISKVQDNNHPVYRINHFYFKEKNKFLSVNHMLEAMNKTMTIAAKYSPKTPIFFIDNRLTSCPADLFRKIFGNSPFHFFVFDEKSGPISELRNLFIEFIRVLPALDAEAKELSLKNRFSHCLSNEDIDRVLDLVKIKLGNEARIGVELYVRAEKILTTIERLKENFTTFQDIEAHIEELDWENEIYIIR